MPALRSGSPFRKEGPCNGHEHLTNLLEELVGFRKELDTQIEEMRYDLRSTKSVKHSSWESFPGEFYFLNASVNLKELQDFIDCMASVAKTDAVAA